MQVHKELIGKARYEIEEYIEPMYLREMNLEYYIIETDALSRNDSELNLYGIQVVKKEVDKFNSVLTETELVTDISSDKEGVKEILDKLVRNKVTPVALHDVLEDFSRIMN